MSPEKRFISHLLYCVTMWEDWFENVSKLGQLCCKAAAFLQKIRTITAKIQPKGCIVSFEANYMAWIVAESAIGWLDHPDDILVDREHIAFAGDILDQQFADHLIAQRITQAFDSGGTRGFVAFGCMAARNHTFDFST